MSNCRTFGVGETFQKLRRSLPDQEAIREAVGKHHTTLTPGTAP